MTDEQIELACRANACKRWRWISGMLAVRVKPLKYCAEGADPQLPVGNRYRVLYVAEGDSGYVYCDANVFSKDTTEHAPDLTDPATMGCLLALIREVWGNPRIALVPMIGEMWGVAIPNPLREGPRFKAPTEVESLIAALEAAP